MSDEVTREELERLVDRLKDCEDPMLPPSWPVRPAAYLRLARAYLALLDERDRLRERNEELEAVLEAAQAHDCDGINPCRLCDAIAAVEEKP